jgi:hypothetical protein
MQVPSGGIKGSQCREMEHWSLGKQTCVKSSCAVADRLRLSVETCASDRLLGRVAHVRECKHVCVSASTRATIVVGILRCRQPPFDRPHDCAAT